MAPNTASHAHAAGHLAGIDIGTTGAKAIVFDLSGNPLGSLSRKRTFGVSGWAGSRSPRLYYRRGRDWQG